MLTYEFFNYLHSVDEYLWINFMYGSESKEEKLRILEIYEEWKS